MSIFAASAALAASVIIAAVVLALIFTSGGDKTPQTPPAAKGGLTVDLALVQIVLALVGAFNYSLNNAAKEILYCATDTETLFRFKPMIEGPCMRAGDVGSSILRLIVMGVAAKFALDQVAEINIFIVITCVLPLLYLRAAWTAGKTYDFELRAKKLSAPETDEGPEE